MNLRRLNLQRRIAQLVRLYCIAALALGAAAFASGAVTADICDAHRFGTFAGDKPSLCFVEGGAESAAARPAKRADATGRHG
jgi:hypothetical protein